MGFSSPGLAEDHFNTRYDSDSSGVVDDAETAAPNTPDWTEDPGSPAATTSGSSVTLTLSNTYDLVLCHAKCIGGSGNFANLDLQINGDTGTNYNAYTVTGVKSTGDSRWASAIRSNGGGEPRGMFLLSGRWGNGAGYKSMGLAHDPTAGIAVYGWNKNVTSPLDSITLTAGGTTLDSIELEAYGRDVAP